MIPIFDWLLTATAIVILIPILFFTFVLALILPVLLVLSVRDLYSKMFHLIRGDFDVRARSLHGLYAPASPGSPHPWRRSYPLRLHVLR